jgi:hypothetical protein
MAASVALPLVGIEASLTLGDSFDDELAAGPPVGVVTHPEALLCCLPRHHTNDGQAVIGISPMAIALIGT